MSESTLSELSVEQCEEFLEQSPVGRVGFSYAGAQVILPVNYRYLDGAIIFRTLFGQKMHVAAAENPVAFEIDAWNEFGHSGWSVLVKGRAERILEYEALAEADDIGPRPWADAAADGGWVRIVPDEITGRWLS